MRQRSDVAVLVLAKAPGSGRSKTRLSPPCTQEQAADIAEAALEQTLRTVETADAGRRVLVLDGAPGPWVPDGFEVIHQRGRGLDERLAAAFEDVGGPALLIGMDTPQVRASMLEDAIGRMSEPGVDIVLGAAEDGGWWTIGLRRPCAAVFLGVPMSSGGTLRAQRARLGSLGLRVQELQVLRDVDGFDDALVVASMLPDTAFARAVAAVDGSGSSDGRRGAGDGADIGDRRARSRTTAFVLAAWAGLVVACAAWGEALRHGGLRTFVNAVPLTGNWDPRPSARILPALALGAAVVALAPRASRRASWRRLLAGAIVVGAAWATLLALSDGPGGPTISAVSPVDYLPAVPSVGSPVVFLREFVDRIGEYPSNVRGHPPGMVLLLWGMDRIGLSGPWPLVVLELGSFAALAPAALVALREVADERSARAAAPFVVLAPAAVFVTSGDALFAAVGAWSMALVILATGRQGRRSDALALCGGLLFGVGLFLSYGLVLVWLVPIVVSLARRRVRPLAVASAGIAAVALAFLGFGFWWVEGLFATRLQYLAGIARRRPYGFFLIANLAAFALAVGPATAVALARLRDHRVWLIVGAALAVVVVADLSALSKGEVERIWLPFVPWVMLATCVLGRRDRSVRSWLGAQAASAIAIQLAVRSPW